MILETITEVAEWEVSKSVCCWCFTKNRDGPALWVRPAERSVRCWWLCLMVPLFAAGL